MNEEIKVLDEMNLLKPLQETLSEALDPTGGPEKLTGMLDVLMAGLERAQAGADGLFVNMALTHEVKKLKAENERMQVALRFAITQNEQDMLMTGEELRKCRAAMEGTNHD